MKKMVWVGVEEERCVNVVCVVLDWQVREGANVSVVPGRSETGRSAVVWGRIDEPVHPVVLEGVVEGNDGKRVQERVQPR